MLLLMLLNACDSGADASRPAVVTRSCSIQWSGSPEPAPAPVAKGPSFGERAWEWLWQSPREAASAPASEPASPPDAITSPSSAEKPLPSRKSVSPAPSMKQEELKARRSDGARAKNEEGKVGRKDVQIGLSSGSGGGQGGGGGGQGAHGAGQEIGGLIGAKGGGERSTGSATAQNTSGPQGAPQEQPAQAQQAQEIPPQPASNIPEVAAAKPALKKKPEAPADPAPAPPLEPPKPEPEWGAEIHLSNDDSMSLASAQRLLWAAEQGARIESRQVRPHEFLNYFHFPTAPLTGDQTFSVQTSALADQDGRMPLAFSVAGASVVRQPLDLTFVLDRSGSMQAGGRMNYIQRGLHLIEKQLQKGDRVDVVLFDNDACAPLENYVVGRDDPALFGGLIDAMKPRGGTDLGTGLKEGYRIVAGRTPEDTAGRNRRVILITDALVNEGQLDPDILAQIGAAYEESDVRLTGVGVGREFSDAVLDKLTEKGHGPYLYLGSEAVVDRFFGQGFLSMTHTLAHDVRFSVDLPDSLAQEKFYGEESSTVESDIQPINYQSGNAQLFLQDLLVRGGLSAAGDEIAFRIRWKDPVTEEAKEQRVVTTVAEALKQSPAAIQKARALMAWTDMAAAYAGRGDACGALYTVWQERLKPAGEDAELGWLDGLTQKACGERGAWYNAQLPLPRGSVKVSKVQVQGADPRSEASIQRRMQNDLTRFQSCQETAVRERMSATGAVVLRLMVKDGRVTNAVATNSTVDARLQECVVRAVRSFRFVATDSGDATVELRFSL